MWDNLIHIQKNNGSPQEEHSPQNRVMYTLFLEYWFTEL